MESAVMRCKMRVESVMHQKNADGATEYEEVTLSAVYSNEPGSENAQWSKWTPSATFKVMINNPGAMNKLSNGHEFYVDFIPATPVKE